MRRVIDGRERIRATVRGTFETFGWAEANEEALGLGDLHFLLVSVVVSVCVSFCLSVVSLDE